MECPFGKKLIKLGQSSTENVVGYGDLQRLVVTTDRFGFEKWEDSSWLTGSLTCCW